MPIRRIGQISISATPSARALQLVFVTDRVVFRKMLASDACTKRRFFRNGHTHLLAGGIAAAPDILCQPSAEWSIREAIAELPTHRPDDAVRVANAVTQESTQKMHDIYRSRAITSSNGAYKIQSNGRDDGHNETYQRNVSARH